MTAVARGVNPVLGFRTGGSIGGKGHLKTANLWPQREMTGSKEMGLSNGPAHK